MFSEQKDPVNVIFQGTKLAEGAPLAEFSFGVFNQNSQLVATANNNADGVITFPPVIFTTVGTFQYTIRELTASSDEWITDPTVFPVNIVVRMVGADLIADVDYPDGPPIFTNIFRQITSCPVTGHQTVDICVPVSVTPTAVVGPITTTCCGAPVITPGTNICSGIPNETCNFTITQTICIDVPVEFSANVNTGETFVNCESISTEITCQEECGELSIEIDTQESE